MQRLLHLLGGAMLAAALSALAACATGGAGAVNNGSFTLLPLQSATLGPNVTLHYDRVVDSRCPANVQCIQAGTLAYRVSLASHGAREAFELTEAAPEFRSAALTGLRIVLANPTVPARVPAGAVPPAYPVVLNVLHD